MGKTCPDCGTDNTQDSEFCKKCGTQIREAEGKPLPTQTIEAAREELTTGSTFAGRYQIIEELGRGGMGRVYKVLDKEVNAKVALKLIKPEVASDKKTIERFRNELKVARDIAHKNVCRMYDLGKEEGAYYITMEYVSGEDLKNFIRRAGFLSSGKAISIANQVCEGLIEAHRLGVVHRDLKPQNIMIDKDGNARIMDFGIARSLRAKGITGSGVMIGTPEYMSPEQVDGKEADQRADIYSLGVILYEMVTGRVPFEGDTPFSIGVKQKSEIPRAPKEINEQISEDLNSLILKCMEKEKEKRYQSAGALHSELNNLEKGIPTTERIIPERKPLTSREITVQFSLKKIFIPALIFIFVVIIGLILWQVLPSKKAVPLAASGKPSLAVMYFKNNTGDEKFDTWRSALSDSIITDLSQSKFMKVLSGDKLYSILRKFNLLETESYASEDLIKVAAEGGVNHILQGGLSKAGDIFRIDYTLKDINTGEIIGSDRVEGEGEESIFAMVDELTKRIKSNLKLTEMEIANDIDKEVGQITTRSPEAYKFYMEGKKFHWNDDNRTALKYYESAAAIDPEFASAYRAIAVSSYNLGLFNEEKKYLQKALELSDRVSTREQYQIQGDYYFRSETYDKSIEAFSRLLELYPDDINANNMLGIIYADIEEWGKAIERHEVNVQNRVELMYAYTNLASAYRGKGLYDKAREVLEFYLHHFPDHPYIHHALSLLYIQSSELDLALLEEEKAFKLDPTDFVNFMRKGDIFLYKGDLIKAEREYQKLLQATEPVGHAWGAIRLAYLYSLQGRFEKSKSMILQGIDLSRNFGQTVWRSLFLYALAENQRITGHPEESLKECDSAWNSADKAEYPSVQRVALHSKGLAFVEMNSMTEAAEAAHKLKQMIEERLNRKEIRIYEHLMGMIELKRRNYAQAIEYFEEAISLLSYGPPTQRADFIASLAFASYRAGDLDKALEEYVRITSLTSGRLEYGDIYAKSFYMLGKIYEQQNNKARAIEHYEKFLDLWRDADPGIDEVDDARKRLVGLNK
jgi:serine/threonine protein kinase/tetratricopeptide (TPR) repeat protein